MRPRPRAHLAAALRAYALEHPAAAAGAKGHPRARLRPTRLRTRAVAAALAAAAATLLLLAATLAARGGGGGATSGRSAVEEEEAASDRPAELRDPERGRRSGAFVDDRERADSSPRTTNTTTNGTAGPEQPPRSPHERERDAYIADSGFRPDAASTALVQRFKASGASPPFVPPFAAPR